MLRCFTAGSHPLRRFRLHNNDKYHSDLPEGFQYRDYPDGKFLGKRPRKPKVPVKVTNVEQLKGLIGFGYRITDLDVRGDTAYNGSDIHPVIKALHDRKAQHSIPGNRTDGQKIALAIEGGGMRGCVAAGMTVVWILLSVL